MLPPYDTLDGLDLLAFVVIALLVLLAKWLITRPIHGIQKPEPQHHRRLEMREPPFGTVGVGRVPRYAVKGEPTWEFPPPLDLDYEGDNPRVEAGRDETRRWLLADYSTPFTR